MMKFSEMPYERPDVEAIKQSLASLTKQMAHAKSAQEQAALLQQYNNTMEVAETAMTLCQIRNTIDTRDAFYAEEQEYCNRILPIITEQCLVFERALAGSKFRPELEEQFGSLMFQNIDLSLKGFSPEIVSLAQEENALTTQYQKLYASAQVEFNGKRLTIAQLTPFKEHPDRDTRRRALEAEGGFFDAHREQFDEIFDKLVKNRTAQAHQLGFKNFVELGYIRQMRNCYGPEDVANFRRQVVRDIVPITQRIKQEQAKSIGLSDFKFYDNSFRYPDGNAVPQGTPEQLLAAGLQMYTELSPETASFIRLMFERELFDVIAKEGKAPGGYCTGLATYQCPFIFSNFNGTSGDVDVLTHEAGHAFADYLALEIEPRQLRNPTMEVCETHSMSMEFLTEPWHHLFFKEQTAKYERTHAEDALLFLPYGCMVDHFQEIIYSHPELTPAQRNETWLKLEHEYRPYIDFDNLPFYARGAGWQRQGHIYQSPFYYIDYCMAQTIALQFWDLAMQDRAKAWDQYLTFARQGGRKTFVDAVRSVGLVPPTDDGCLVDVAKGVQAWLEAHPIAK